MDVDEFLRENADTLFREVCKIHAELKIGEDASQVRNVVRRGMYKRSPCFVKIGRKENLENLLAFVENIPTTHTFQIPECMFSGEIEYQDKQLTYYVEKAVDGISLLDSRDLETFSKKVLNIVLEIDNFPNLHLLIPSFNHGR